MEQRRLWQQRIAEPLKGLLRQGLTPEKLALALACGVATGLFPVIGATTILGLATAGTLRLNLPALQLANWVAYPAQIAMILPLVRLGEWLAGAPPVPFSIPQVVASMWMAERYPDSQVTAVSNSVGQRAFIEARAERRDLSNVTVVTADMNRFAPAGRSGA